MNVFEYVYERKVKEKNKQEIRFQWVSNLEIAKRNLEEMIHAEENAGK